ncbi:MAG TPA: hypothetical protein VIK04_13100 [Solirubrobacteraceae bacterium]
MDTRRPPLSLLAAAIVTLSVAACGSSTTVARDGTLRIALSEYRVVPQDVHTTAGILTLVVHNYGRLTHDLVISLGGQPEISSEPIGPGQTQVLNAALIPGRYVMASSILSDQALGVYGTLDVGS